MKKTRKSGKGLTPNDNRKAMTGSAGRLKKPGGRKKARRSGVPRY